MADHVWMQERDNAASGYAFLGENTYVADTEEPDVTPPVITLLGETPVTHGVGTPYVDAGATALDDVDGNITDNIVTVNPVNSNVVGSYLVTYNVDDAAGNSATEVVRVVDVVDFPPTITRIGPGAILHPLNTAYVDAGATAEDPEDGTITGSIVTFNPVNTAVPGAYVITYNVDDSFGNSAPEVRRVVIVVDPNAPVEDSGTAIITNLTSNLISNLTGNIV